MVRGINRDVNDYEIIRRIVLGGIRVENQATKLSQAVEKRKEFLKDELMKYGYFKMPEPDNRQLYELTLSELEDIHIRVKCQFGREMNQ